MRRFLPSLSALQAFESASRHLSFTRAAEDLSITQSGISRQIANLEQHLGLRLFERSGSRLVLTDAGREYFRDVEQALDKLEEAAIDLVRSRRADEHLMIGAHPTFASRWLAPRLGNFTRAHPEVPVDIRPVDVNLDFETSRIDLAVIRGAGSWRGTRAVELFTEELAVVASPRLIPMGERHERLDFARFPTLQNASRPRLWTEWLRASGMSRNGIIQGVRFAHSEMLISAAVSGLGLAVVPPQYVERELERGELHTPFGDPVPTKDAYWAVCAERKSQNNSIILFRNWLLRETRRSRAS